jgi:hypothetical protein
MNHLLIHEYFKSLRDCWNCGNKARKGEKCPHCGALPERPRVYADDPDKWAKSRPDK